MSIEIEIDDKKASINSFFFPAGEPNIKVNATGDKANIILKQFQRDDLFTILLANDVLQNALNIKDVSLKIPYLPFSRQDRRCVPNECFGLQVFANQLNSQGFKEVITFDVHSDKAKELVKNLKNIEPSDMVQKIISEQNIDLIIFPDDGALRRYKDLYKTKSIAAKKIRDPQTGHILSYEIDSNQVQDKRCLVIDDICDGGMTFIKLGEAIKGRCETAMLYVSHGIFSKGLTVLQPYYSHIFTTDSICKEENNEYLTVYRCL